MKNELDDVNALHDEMAKTEAFKLLAKKRRISRHDDEADIILSPLYDKEDNQKLTVNIHPKISNNI